MAGFIRSLTNAANAATDMVRSAVAGMGAQPYNVEEINSSQLKKCSLVSREEHLNLYKDGNYYTAVLYNPATSPKHYCVFRLSSDSEAMTTFSAYSCRLQPLYATSKRFLLKDTLQRVCDVIRENPTWNVAHIAAHVGLHECLRSDVVAQHVLTPCEASMLTPVMVAVAAGQVECVQELLIMGVPLNMADHHGENVFHYAARNKNNSIIQLLASRDKTTINQLNLDGESPLHVACLASLPDNVETLLRWEADPLMTRSTRLPIHCAMKVASAACVEVLCRWNKSQIHVQDSKYGGTPLHWAKSQECIYRLADLGCNLEATNMDQETAIQIMIRRNRLDCVMALLTRGARACTVGIGGNNSLHLAIQNDNYDLVQALIVFGADVNWVNNMGHSVRHEAATRIGKNNDEVLYLLHRVGAKRCDSGVANCMKGCGASYAYNGKPPGGKELISPTSAKEAYDAIVDDLAMTAALTRTASASGSAMMMMEDSAGMGNVKVTGDRVLCLDGGGIRGLILIQLLMAVQKAVGRPIRSCFDWVAGTSTGGILALAIVHGKSIEYCQGLYMRLKDEVFEGKRPYDSEPLERFMKREFGENVRMTEVEYPKLLVTAVLGDRHPAELHFFRNYDPPGVNYHRRQREDKFEPVPRPNEQLVWRAARASGAAPTYFRAMGRFVDGGLMSNNPTLDALTEVHEYNMGLKSMGQGEMVQKLHVVVSLGTGIIPQSPVKGVDLYRPSGIFDIVKIGFAASSLGALLIDQATLSEGRPVERARAWCSMIDVPFFRFSPQLSEDVQLDCNDNKTLIHMLWETQCYIVDNWHRFEQLAMLLKQ